MMSPVLNSMRIMFRRQYDTYFAENGPAALGIVKAHDIDVIVCDHRMPNMTGVEVLTQAKALSPRSVRILLTGYADLNAVEGSINDGEVFRFLTKPCAPDELKRTIELATSLAQEPADKRYEAAQGIEITMEEDRVTESLVRHGPQQEMPAAGSIKESAEAAPFDGRSTVVIEKPSGKTESISIDPAARPATAAGMAVLVFSNDDSTYETTLEATRNRIPVYRATNIVQVIRLLDEKQPGVLLTDISEDRNTIQAMTARLKEHLPQLVTVAVSEHRDVLDMVWLINHGQIFRFLRKPLSPGRCALSLKAALEHHRKLLANPALVKRHQVETTDSDSETVGLLSRLNFLKKLWSRA